MNAVGNKRITATSSLAIVMVLVFAVNVAMGGGSRFWIFLTGGGYLKDYGEVLLASVKEQGQWWRLLTCGYLHMGIIHLAANLAALKIVGDRVEEKLGALKLCLIYNVGTVLTAFLWCLIFRSGSIIGSSLGIFVLLGMVCAWIRSGKETQHVSLTPAQKRYLVIYTIIGCFLGRGTIVAHLIGFLIGILIGELIRRVRFIRTKV